MNKGKDIQYWTAYETLEQEVLEITKSIYFDDAQLDVYSCRNADLILRCMCEYESIVKAIYRNFIGRTENKIGKCLKVLDELVCLNKKQVMIVSDSMHFSFMQKFISPLSYKPHDRNDFYSAYCALKHNRTCSINRATVNVLLRSLAAFFIMNLYYYGNQINNIRRDTPSRKTIFLEKYAGESIGIMLDFGINLNRYLCSCIAYVSLDLNYYLYRDEYGYKLKKLIKNTASIVGLQFLKKLTINNQYDIRTLICLMIDETTKEAGTAEKVNQVSSITMGQLENSARLYNINNGYSQIYIPVQHMNDTKEELEKLKLPELQLVDRKLSGIQSIDRIMELLK